MVAKNKFLFVMILLFVFLTCLSPGVFAWEKTLSSGWDGYATGCITIKVDDKPATVTSYKVHDYAPRWRQHATCTLTRGTHKFDFCGTDWAIEGDIRSFPTDVRKTGGGCGFKCLKMQD